MGRPTWNYYIELVSKDYHLHFADEETVIERLGVLPDIIQQVSISIRFYTQVCSPDANDLPRLAALAAFLSGWS